MPRLSYLGALLGIAALLSAPVRAQIPKPKSAPNGARVEHVIVRGAGDTMEVEIQTAGAPVAPNTQAITGPDRIVVDFPGALPAAELRALKVNRGVLKGVRSGLFFSNPPITRIVLDLTKPQPYQIVTTQKAVVVKLGPGEPGSAQLNSAKLAPAAAAGSDAKLRGASLISGAVATAPATVSAAIENITPPPAASEAPAKPVVSVTFTNGLLRIRAEKATLSQVLFEVQQQTQAEIAIPAGAEQEEVAADLGPGPARDVLASLLNGSPYNFIFVGNEMTLERVILSRRDSSLY